MRGKLITCGVVVALLLLGAAQYADAAPTILTGVKGDLGDMPTHGSNAPDTPDITLLWASTGNPWSFYGNWDGRGPAYSIESSSGYDTRTITFTPASGYDVQIDSFDLDEWAGGGNPFSANWTVSGADSGTIASGTWTLTTGGGRSTVTADATGAGGEVVTLTIQQTVGTHDYLAMDNLTFEQVPEPASLALLAAGGIGALLRRRRHA